MNHHGCWEEFYSNIIPHKTYTHQSKAVDAIEYNYYVSLCKFRLLITQGAIKIISNTLATKLLCDTSEFISCSRYGGEGGSILFKEKGQCVQDRIYSDDSSVSSEFTKGVYSYSEISAYESFKNKIIYSSIENAGKSNRLGSGTICMVSGGIEIQSCNMYLLVTPIQVLYIT